MHKTQAYSRVNPLAYSFTALMNNQFGDNDPPFLGGRSLLEHFGVAGQSVWCVAMRHVIPHRPRARRAAGRGRVDGPHPLHLSRLIHSTPSLPILPASSGTEPERLNIGVVWGFFAALVFGTWLTLSLRRYERR